MNTVIELYFIWREIREYITRNLFSYRTQSRKFLISNDTIGLKQ